MKTLFIEAQRRESEFLNLDSLGSLDNGDSLDSLDNKADNKELDKLPDEIFLAYSIQYKKLAERIREKLEKLGKKIKGFKQVLGCSELKSEFPVLLISSGEFHAINLILQENSVFLLEGNKIREIENKYIEKIKSRRKSALSKFLSANKAGIIVSCKPGQENLKEALKIKEDLEKKGKKTCIFLADSISIDELENYDVDSWINTACPGLILDSLDNRILNFKELRK